MNGHNRTEDRALAQGAFRSGDWKLLVNVWCSGYYSHDPDVLEVSIGVVYKYVGVRYMG